MTPARVSVVIPAFNAEAHLADAVRSVLGQSVHDVECIVVDDGSTDDTARVAAAIDEPRLKVLSLDHRGASLARNAGASIATGQHLAFLDADDVWLPNKLALQLAALEDNPDAPTVITGYAVTDEQLRPRWIVRSSRPRRRLQRWIALEGEGPALLSTLLLRRELWEELGGFDQRFPLGEDLHFGARLLAASEVVSLPVPLALIRSHAAQQHRHLDLIEQRALELYGDVLTDESASLRRRSLANLYVRLAATALRRGRLRTAATALRRACAHRPLQVVVLPTRLIARRVMRLARETLLPRPKIGAPATVAPVDRPDERPVALGA